METSNRLPDLPQEIITNIFLRLPAKSLLKLRCVCKSWHSLISSSEFTKTHLNISRKTNINSTFIFSTSSTSVTYLTFPISALSSNTPMENFKFCNWDLLVRNGRHEFSLVGTCNGLLCLNIMNDHSLFICNPLVRKLVKLPDSGTRSEKVWYVSYGFCFDEFNDDYNVVEIIFDYKDCRYLVNVYSLMNNSWRTINDKISCCDSYTIGYDGYPVGGILHWRLINSCTDEEPLLILAVDTVTNRIRMVAPPLFDVTGVPDYYGLMVFGASLAIVCEYYTIGVDIWVMNEYGNEETWVRVISIPEPEELRGFLCPLFVFENGDILLKSARTLLLYNSRKGSFTSRELEHFIGHSSLKVASFVESLFAPSFDGEHYGVQNLSYIQSKVNANQCFSGWLPSAFGNFFPNVLNFCRVIFMKIKNMF